MPELGREPLSFFVLASGRRNERVSEREREREREREECVHEKERE